MIFLIATIAIGPGLIVNLGLKDHWHRPRPDPDPGVQRAEPLHALVRGRRRLQEELFVRLGRGGDRLLDGRPGERPAVTLAGACGRRRFRFRNRGEPPAHGLRRPLPVRRAARRPRHADGDRDRAEDRLADRPRSAARGRAARQGDQTAADVAYAALVRAEAPAAGDAPDGAVRCGRTWPFGLRAARRAAKGSDKAVRRDAFQTRCAPRPVGRQQCSFDSRRASPGLSDSWSRSS